MSSAGPPQGGSSRAPGPTTAAAPPVAAQHEVPEMAEQPLPPGDRNANPEGIGFLALLREDFQTHGGTLASPGFWALATHRFGNWRMGVPVKPLRAPLTFAYRAAHWAATALWGIDLPYNAKIGRRFHIVHHGAVFVGSREIGDDVCVRHAVTIGLKRKSERRAPRIGSRVEIGPGACIVGDIEVGDDCLIGANTVLAQNAPDGSTVLGVPGRFVELAKHLDPTPTR